MKKKLISIVLPALLLAVSCKTDPTSFQSVVEYRLNEDSVYTKVCTTRLSVATKCETQTQIQKAYVESGQDMSKSD